jgi:hypothetical protein
VIAVTDLPAHIADRIAVNDETDCWEWTGHLNTGGYVRFRMGADKPRAYLHRVVYQMLVDPSFPIWIGGPNRGPQLDHLCCVPRCVNPAHLEPVSCAENLRRVADRALAARGGERRSHLPATSRHGTTTSYGKYRCRCDACRMAKRRWVEGAKLRRATA